MQKSAVEIWVGLFMAMGIAAIALLALKVSGPVGAGGESFRIQARFENVGGLNERAPVMVGGVRIGRVTKISMDKEDYSAVVDMDIDVTYDNLSIDTSASVLTTGLLGAKFIGLEPGAEEIFLVEGDEIEITQSSIQLETLISQFMFNRAAQSSE